MERKKEKGKEVCVNAAGLRYVMILPTVCDEGASDEAVRSEPQSRG